MNLKGTEYLQLAEEARHLGGYVAVLRSLASSRLPTERIRELCNDAYNSLDAFLTQVEKLEKRAEKREKNEKAV